MQAAQQGTQTGLGIAEQYAGQYVPGYQPIMPTPQQYPAPQSWQQFGMQTAQQAATAGMDMGFAAAGAPTQYSQ